MRVGFKALGLCFGLLFFTGGCASTPSAGLLKENPDLQPADGEKNKIEWKKADRFDEAVFYGRLPADPSAGAGIYVGGRPSFKPPADGMVIKGKLGVFDVNWYVLQSDKPKFYRTCLIEYQKATVGRGRRASSYYTLRHVWVFAETEAGLEAMIAEVGRIKMFAVHPPDLTM
ncbi:MAG TPA: hypothetical protein VGR78_19780 [Verrucomicrobiae bacterium]|jgi:hypothetical protein|nr:hypothetical protein [Verrucomicrobiae bacterium]